MISFEALCSAHYPLVERLNRDMRTNTHTVSDSTNVSVGNNRETKLWALCPLPRPARAVFEPDSGFHHFASELQQKNKRSLDICFPLTLHLNKITDSFYLWYLQTSVYAGSHFINPVRLQTILWEVSLQPDKRSNTMFLLYCLSSGSCMSLVFYNTSLADVSLCHAPILKYNHKMLKCA